MMEEKMKPKFGQLFEISRDQYVSEVNEAPKGTNQHLGAYVVLHLYQSYLEKCNLVNMHLQSLSKGYPNVKFIKILSTRCIENFPDSNLPCIIIYKDGQLQNNIPNFDRLNYLKSLSKRNMLRAFMKLKVIDFEEIDSSDVII